MLGPVSSILEAPQMLQRLTDIDLHSAFSPNFCAVVSLGENYDMKLGLMQLSPRVDGAIDHGMISLHQCYSSPLNLEQLLLKQQQKLLHFSFRLHVLVTALTPTTYSP